MFSVFVGVNCYWKVFKSIIIVVFLDRLLELDGGSGGGGLNKVGFFSGEIKIEIVK